MSPKPALFVKESSDVVADNSNTETSHKAGAIGVALTQSGIVSTSAGPLTSGPRVQASRLNAQWSEYPGNNPNKLNKDCLVKLKELYDFGKINKKQKVNADRAHQILVDTILVGEWAAQLDLTVPKIKAFFSMTPTKQRSTIEQLSIDPADLQQAEEALVETERNTEALSLLDIDQEEDNANNPK